MEGGAPPPPRGAADLRARMAELRGMVEDGLLEEEDIAEEVLLLKAEAKAWRLSSAAVRVERAAACAAGRLECGAARGGERAGGAGRPCAPPPAVMQTAG